MTKAENQRVEIWEARIDDIRVAVFWHCIFGDIYRVSMKIRGANEVVGVVLVSCSFFGSPPERHTWCITWFAVASTETFALIDFVDGLFLRLNFDDSSWHWSSRIFVCFGVSAVRVDARTFPILRVTHSTDDTIF